MTSIYNGTQHEINFYLIDQCDQSNPRKLIVKQGEQPTFTIPGGENLNAKTGNGEIPEHLKECSLDFAISGGVQFTEVDSLPYDNDKLYDIYIVSNLFRSAFIELNKAEFPEHCARLATVQGVVYNSPSNPRPCGCLGLAVG